jgi:light-regulated signal transduction histidine kinase (bacteriophytochrome)
MTPVNCNLVVEHVLADLATAIEDCGGKVEAGNLPIIHCDSIQISQLLQNLIANGLKFRSTDHPRVIVTAERQDDQWIFAVRDNGIGIDPKHAERIFEVFSRLDDSREYPGTGIGLAICRKIVERHGGRIWVESEPGAGATFSFTLPVGQGA